MGASSWDFMASALYCDLITLVKTAHGKADTKLSSQMRRMIFLAFPIEDLARGESGLQIARYLKLSFSPPGTVREHRETSQS